jgi:hypothetical protein
MENSEDGLQTMAYQLNLTAREYKINIPSTKTKSMAMCGNQTKRVKIVINGSPIERVSYFKYLGYTLHRTAKVIYKTSYRHITKQMASYRDILENRWLKKQS